jgi:hypothetical protein
MGVYQIKVKGHLDQQWQELFMGMEIYHNDDGTTILKGELSDQTALHAVRSRIRDLGVPLIKVGRGMPISKFLC